MKRFMIKVFGLVFGFGAIWLGYLLLANGDPFGPIFAIGGGLFFISASLSSYFIYSHI